MSSDELRRAVARVTSARVLLGRAGPALPTRAWLEFQLAHARARDAVLAPCDLEGLASALRARAVEAVVVRS
ncbi:MAG TPA: ethanolamine ammonia-lyase light chain EutC, partial [Nannocystis sp.]